MQKTLTGWRWFLCLLLPLAMAVSLLCYQRCARLSAVYSAFVTQNSCLCDKPHWLTFFPTKPLMKPKHDYPRDEMAELRTDSNRLAYWERHQHETGAYRYHAYAASWEYNDKVIQRGKALEPNNALYDVLEANMYLTDGISCREERATGLEHDIIHDRAAVEKGIAALCALARKPYLTDYTVELSRERIAQYPTPRITEDYLRDQGMLFVTLFPNLSKYRSLARKIPGCARLLIAEGRTREAEELLDLWKPFAVLVMGEDNPLMHNLVGMQIGSSLSTHCADLYQQLGREEKARELRQVSERLIVVRAIWSGRLTKKFPVKPAMLVDGLSDQDTTYSEENLTEERYLQQYGSFMQQMFLTAGTVPSISTYDLAPGRWHERVVAETLASGLIVTVLAALLLLCGVLQCCWWVYARRRERPPLLLPSRREVAQGILLAIVLPYALYFLVTRLPIAVNARGIPAQPLLVYSELGLLLVVVVGAVLLWSYRLAYRAALRAGVDLPDTRRRRYLAFLLIVLFLLLPAAFVLTLVYDYTSVENMIGAIVVLAMTTVILLTLVAKKDYGFHAVHTRYLLVGLVSAILALGAVIMPWHLAQELSTLKKDRLIYGHIADRTHPAGGLSLREVDSTRLLRQWALSTLDGELPEEVRSMAERVRR